MMLLRVYVAGLAVLVGAIAMNALAGALGLATWYSFLTSAGELGALVAIRRLNVVDVLFLVVAYPALLGVCAWLVLHAWR